MQGVLITIFLTIAISTLLNIVLKRFGVSHILGYILTGTIISYGFDFNGINIKALELIAEFGIVFLMFTIGLEMSLDKIRRMKEILLLNGSLQLVLSSIIIFLLSYFVFSLDMTSSIIISMAFSLSSTAIVLTYLKESKDIHTPYGKKATAILIFQDLAVIPILLLITFLTNDNLSIGEVLVKTFVSALLVIGFLFFIGKHLFNWLLRFSSKAQLEELFLGSVLSIVIGASLLAHEMGFTYSLGAFVAGMVLSETKYRIKIESDIATYKDFLLGTFFFSVGTKIDVVYFINNIHNIFAVLLLIMIIKALVIYFIIKRKSNKDVSIKTALALCQVGEFSFAIFTIASNDNLISSEMASFLMLITILSMVITPFIVNNIYKLASFYVKDYFESDKITPIKASNHVVICGFSTLGRLVAKNLSDKKKDFVIISDDLRHVLLARKMGYKSYFGHLDKLPVLESLKIEQSSSIIITLTNINRKKLISEAVLNYYKDAKIIMKINLAEEKRELKDFKIAHFVHAQKEVANLLTKKINEN